VVEEVHHILAVEKTRQYSGLYHVLGGALSPLDGIGPDQLKLKSLIERLKGATVEEIIIATNPTAEGEATAVYVSKLIKPLGVRVTRIGVGIPVGADLEYADESTMLKAMEGRRDL
jgi:recombination protein RecR